MRLFILCFSLASNLALAAVYNDWVYDANSLCQGRYIAKTLPPYSTNVDITSNSLDCKENSLYKFNGAVQVNYQGKQLFTDRLLVHNNANKMAQLDAQGNVELYEANWRILAERIVLDKATDTKTISTLQYHYYPRHAQGEATQATFKAPLMELCQASYTTCAPTQQSWLLKAQEITLDKSTGRGVAKKTTLYWQRLPIFYAPYINFPIDARRQSGFLYPSIGSNSQRGFYTSAPFYWNLAPNYDATITPTWMQKRGLEVSPEFRHLNHYGTTKFNLAILQGDRAYKDFRFKNLSHHPLLAADDKRIIALQRQHNTRYALNLDSDYITQNLRATLQYQQVSDSNYFQDYSPPNLSLANNSYLLQRATLYYDDNNWQNSLNFAKHQVLHPLFGPVSTEPYRHLPQLKLFGQHFINNYQLSLKGELTHFSKRSDTLNTGIDHLRRYILRPSISYPYYANNYFIRPRAQLNLAQYNITAQNKVLQRNIPLFDLLAGVTFSQTPSANWQHNIEPKFYYLYVPYKEQSHLPIIDSNIADVSESLLFNDNRFMGLDRIGDTHQFTYAFTSSLINNSLAHEYLTTEIGQIRYFKKRQVTLPLQDNIFAQQETLARERAFSPIMANLQLRYISPLRVRVGVEWNPYSKQLDKTNIQLQYKPSSDDVYNIGLAQLRHNYFRLDTRYNTPERLQQIYIAASKKIKLQWRLLGAWHYNYWQHQTNRALVGVEYDSCCVAVRFMLHSALMPFDPLKLERHRYNKGFAVELIFKGLAGVGSSSITSNARTLIPGYEWHKDRF